MDHEKKRILLFGPGYGHNVEAKLRGLNDQSLFDVVFLANRFDESFKDKYTAVHFVPFTFLLSKRAPLHSIKSVWTLFKQVRFTGHYDVLYSLGEVNIMAFLVFLFAKNKTKKALELWSVHSLVSANRNKSFHDRVKLSVIKRADFVCQFWWGIREVFVNSFPQYESKFLMYQLSYSDDYFTGLKHNPESDFVKNFLNRIPNDQIVCFWPRSFIPSTNHKLFLDALGLVKKKSPQLLVRFKLYLWGGNVEDATSRMLIEEAIRRNMLENNVEIVDHPYVPRNDIFAIEERSDFFAQIANDDILSTFIMEIISSGKPFVLSNLRTFQFLNEKYNLNIDLVENDVSIIADKVIRIIEGKETINVKEFERRRQICVNSFARSNVNPWYKILYSKL